MHADAGKANQYYLRGWNLDHGTDLATFWDDVPINLPTHAHGQGYTDLNWLIPETVGGLDIRKGPYLADVGDFANAGNLHISVRDSVDQNIESVTVGSFGYARFLALGSTKARRRHAALCRRIQQLRRSVDQSRRHEEIQRPAALQPGHGDGRFFGHRDGLYQHLELHRSESRCGPITTGQIGPLWHTRPDRWRRHQPLLAVGPDGAIHRRRIVESQCLSRQIHDEPVQQLHL